MIALMLFGVVIQLGLIVFALNGIASILERNRR